MVGWHHWLNGYEFEQAPEDSEGQACSSPWDCKELDTTEQQQQHIEVVEIWRVRTMGWERIYYVYRGFFCTDKIVLRFDCGDGCPAL